MVMRRSQRLASKRGESRSSPADSKIPQLDPAPALNKPNAFPTRPLEHREKSPQPETSSKSLRDKPQGVTGGSVARDGSSLLLDPEYHCSQARESRPSRTLWFDDDDDDEEDEVDQGPRVIEDERKEAGTTSIGNAGEGAGPIATISGITLVYPSWSFSSAGACHKSANFEIHRDVFSTEYLYRMEFRSASFDLVKSSELVKTFNLVKSPDSDYGDAGETGVWHDHGVAAIIPVTAVRRLFFLRFPDRLHVLFVIQMGSDNTVGDIPGKQHFVVVCLPNNATRRLKMDLKGKGLSTNQISRLNEESMQGLSHELIATLLQTFTGQALIVPWGFGSRTGVPSLPCWLQPSGAKGLLWPLDEGLLWVGGDERPLYVKYQDVKVLELDESVEDNSRLTMKIHVGVGAVDGEVSLSNIHKENGRLLVRFLERKGLAKAKIGVGEEFDIRPFQSTKNTIMEPKTSTPEPEKDREYADFTKRLDAVIAETSSTGGAETNIGGDAEDRRGESEGTEWWA